MSLRRSWDSRPPNQTRTTTYATTTKPSPRPSCNAAVQNTETHKAFNCDHEFLKQIIFSKYLFVYIFAVIRLKAGQTICGVHIGVAGKNSTVNHIILCNILCRNTMTQLPPFSFFVPLEVETNKYLAREKTVVQVSNFRFSIFSLISFNDKYRF